MRGESRRCRGSKEPLLKLPDGALATRRIVSLSGALLRRPRVAGVRLKRRAAQQLCRLTTRRRRARTFCIATRTSDAEMSLNAQLVL